MPKEYRTIQEVAGPLMLVREVEGVAYNELGEIELANGEKRRCRVLEVDGTNALVQLFESSTGINLAQSKVRFLGRQMELGLSLDMLGRVFDGLGRPIDGGPEIIPEKRADVNGVPMNPAARSYPQNLFRQAFPQSTDLTRLSAVRSFRFSPLRVCPMRSLPPRLQGRQRLEEQTSSSPLFLPQWVSRLRKRTSSPNLSGRPVRLTGR